ncbi:uncharacterized protein ISCGN_032269 [Ixodes scapularis]
MDESDREKTAFNTPSGHYQWRRMPMGLVNSSAVWQRTADVIFAGISGKSCHLYLDDVIILSHGFDQYLADVESVLMQFRAAGLKLGPSKCQFLKEEEKYFGHILSRQGVRPDPDKLSSVHNFPTPRNAKKLLRAASLRLYKYSRKSQSPSNGRPWDIMRPLPLPTQGNRYLLVFVEHLTRYTEVISMPDQQAETVASLFVERVVMCHGTPQQLLTDRGANFTPKLLQEVRNLLGVQKILTTPDHPQCNGAVERLNQAISGILGHYVARD